MNQGQVDGITNGSKERATFRYDARGHECALVDGPLTNKTKVGSRPAARKERRRGESKWMVAEQNPLMLIVVEADEGAHRDPGSIDGD